MAYDQRVVIIFIFTAPGFHAALGTDRKQSHDDIALLIYDICSADNSNNGKLKTDENKIWRKKNELMQT